MSKSYDPFHAVIVSMHTQELTVSEWVRVRTALQRYVTRVFRAKVKRMRNVSIFGPMRILSPRNRKQAKALKHLEQCDLSVCCRRRLVLDKAMTRDQLEALLTSWVSLDTHVNMPWATVPTVYVANWECVEPVLTLTSTYGASRENCLDNAMAFHNPKPAPVMEFRP